MSERMEATPPSAAQRALYPSFDERPHTLPEQLERQAQVRPERVAVVAEDGAMTFARWRERMRRGAGVLRAHGVAAGDYVALWAPNRDGAAWAAALLAIQRAGAVPVPITSRAPLAAAEARLARLGCRVAVVAGDAGAPPDGVTAVATETLDAGAADAELGAGAQPSTAVAVFHTSGTTGTPKPALISHVAFSYTSAATEHHILSTPVGVAPLTADDVIQTSIPLHTSSALVHYIAISLWSGCGLVCEPRFDTLGTVAAMREQRSTIWLTVPAMMTLVTDAVPEPQRDLALRVVWHMGSVASRECVSQTLRTFPDAAVLNLYSLTESHAAMIVSDAADARERPGSSGHPLPNCELRVVDVETGAPLAPGEPGTIHMRSPYTFDRYVGMPEATRDAIRADGWLATGDAGVLDEDGVVWVRGRVGDMIVRGGLNIDPVAIEAAIEALDEVAEAALVPIPHRVLGSDIVALVSLRGEHDDPTELVREHLLGSFAPNEVPRRVLVADALPRNEFGKLDRARARTLVLERLELSVS